MPPLHSGQLEVAQDAHRFRVLACGRRWGKTRLGIVLTIEGLLTGLRWWWVAPTYAMSAIAWRPARSIVGALPGIQVRESDRCLLFPGGGEVWWKSADNEDALRGEGLDGLIVDEAAFVRERVWAEVLRPALADHQGRAVFASTPRGRNWFWRLWLAGQGVDPEIKSWRFPTTSNPYIASSEIEAARASMPARIFAQEFEADFTEDGGGVFRGVREAVRAERQTEPIEGHTYAFGVDWGKHEDFTAVKVLDLTAKAEATSDRFNRVDYTLQRDRLRTLYDRFKPRTVIAERNSMGEPVIEQLQRDGMRVQPFLTTNATKAAAIEYLALLLERGELALLDDPVTIGELEAFESRRLPSGLSQYSAPSGMHDDCVMALALACQAIQTGAPRIHF